MCGGIFSLCSSDQEAELCYSAFVQLQTKIICLKKKTQSKFQNFGVIYRIEGEGCTLLYTIDTWDKLLKVLYFILEVWYVVVGLKLSIKLL